MIFYVLKGGEIIRTVDNKVRKAFYADRISDNMDISTEGYLICYNVPIARVGKQDYLGSEIGIMDKANQLIPVIREEKEVFSPKALSSFEGKPITNEHPSVDVSPNNYTRYSKGHVRDVRRGQGVDSDKVVAELVVCDAKTIKEIQNGKREISCGYGCTYELDEDGNVYQTNIEGNHVALVANGRAGHKVRIKDQQVKKERRYKNMSRKKANIFTRILGIANDADPEEVAEILEEVAELQNKDEEAKDKDTNDTEVKDTEQKSYDSEILEKIVSQLDELTKKVEVYEMKDKEKQKDELDILEEELFDENDVTVPVEELAEDEETLDDEATDAEIVVIKNNDSLKKLVRDMKPVIAGIKDDRERKRVIDSLSKHVRDIQGKVKGNSNSYGNIEVARQRKAQDSRSTQNKCFDFDSDEARSLGQEIAKSRNPHFKNK